jgi:hypothetical protein
LFYPGILLVLRIKIKKGGDMNIKEANASKMTPEEHIGYIKRKYEKPSKIGITTPKDGCGYVTLTVGEYKIYATYEELDKLHRLTETALFDMGMKRGDVK